MHSGELARLAGVTVRALRHYHQVGVLAEPARGSNGYRDYDVHDLIRVLRIRRLAALGIPLEQMPSLLDNPGVDGGGLLDALDAELAEQIERLTEQRVLITRLRAHNTPPDLPPDLARFLAVLAAAGLSPELAKIDRDQAVLLAHFVGEEGMPHLARFYERVTAPELIPAVTALSNRFGKLGPSSTEQDITDLVDSFTSTFASVIGDFADSDPPIDLSGSADNFAEYAADLLNDQQRDTLARIAAQLDEPHEK